MPDDGDLGRLQVGARAEGERAARALGAVAGSEPAPEPVAAAGESEHERVARARELQEPTSVDRLVQHRR